MLIVWPPLEIQSEDLSGTEERKNRQNLKNIKLHCSIVKLCGPYIIWHVNKERKKARNNPLNTFLQNLHLFRKIEPTCLRYLHKTTQCPCYTQTRNRYGYKFQHCILRFKLCTSVAYGVNKCFCKSAALLQCQRVYSISLYNLCLTNIRKQTVNGK